MLLTIQDRRQREGKVAGSDARRPPATRYLPCMVTGHLATAYLARARWPRAAIVPLLVASIIPDLADFVLPQGDQCRTACGLYTHAVPAVFVLAGAAAALAWQMFHRRATSVLVAALVMLHVAMDLVTSFKPYWPGGSHLGLALYRWPAADFVLEIALAAIGWVALRRSEDPPRAAVHPAALVLLVAVQAAMDLWFRHLRG